jgi:hypothetical protein
MNQEQVLGIVRHALTFIGGLLIAKGFIDESTSTEIIGTVVGLVGTLWSIVVKKK